jgi:UDP-N-acetylmuramoyl-L-alanyl-D-glutamate--2,6-diaminopimelate ligase
MMPKRLSELISNVSEVLRITGDTDTEITAPVVEDNREVQPGGVFVARAGLSVNGHDFIPDAIQRGAAAIVGERNIRGLPVPYVQVENAMEAVGYLAAAYHAYPSRKLVVIGVTGTDGKTTTSTLIHHILQTPFFRAGLISTVAADVGDKALDTGLHVTTPGAPQVQALLAQMVANGLRFCVIEMTSHGLAQGRLNGIDLDAAVLTNLTHEHLDYHASFEAYRAAKGRMFDMLKHSAIKQRGTVYGGDGQLVGPSYYDKIAVINADDPNAEYFAAFPVDRIVRYGIRNGDYRATDITYGTDRTSFRIIGKHPQLDRSVNFRVTTPLVGEFNVLNCLAAVETCFALHVGSGIIRSRVEKFAGIPGRMERIKEGQDFTAIVDFAHTPNALENALNAGRQMLQPGKRLIAVFGSAGLRDREKRRLMAEISARLADFTILTAEDPRTEALDDILAVMAQACIANGGVEGKTFIRVPDRGEALYRACQMAQAGDIIIACGKGHEQSMCFGSIEYPWDDRDAMRAALRGTPLTTLPTANK